MVMSFNEYLDRLYAQLDQQNRIMQREELKLPRPKLHKQGGVKTIWENFGITAELLQRPVEHMHKFFTSELSTDCNIAKDSDSTDSSSKLCITGKGRYTSDTIIKILHSYVETYVQCKVCGEMHTSITKEQRQLFITCSKCLSKWCCSQE